MQTFPPKPVEIFKALPRALASTFGGQHLIVTYSLTSLDDAGLGEGPESVLFEEARRRWADAPDDSMAVSFMWGAVERRRVAVEWIDFGGRGLPN